MYIKQLFLSLAANFTSTIRIFLGAPGCCRFSITCTQYAKIMLKEELLHIALWRILRRLLICNPFFRS
ncbi:membrane protein insertion efficiency factor YidD [bacterium]|nr:membrane protein insertion efficiency factor YidD [bacterium]MBT5015291.1 membrane protein insertion efficiency factor YidD [bacterium]